MVYQYRGKPLLTKEEEDRYARLDMRKLAREQIDICADTTRKRYQDAMEAKGLTLNINRHIKHDILRDLIDTIATVTNEVDRREVLMRMANLKVGA